MTTIDTSTTVGQLVTERPSRSRVFQKLGIDFCCGGKQSLDEACRSKGLDPGAVLQALLAEDNSAPSQGSGTDPASMTLSDLCDHIEARHHAYLKAELPRLHAMIRKVAAVHGDKHPWMHEVRSVFDELHAEMQSHMMKEEHVLFPIIRRLERGESNAAFHCGGVANPIRVMEHEHDSAGGALSRMRQLSSDYTPPEGACNTFRAMLDGLRELEEDMHQHVHKENNILFPRALQVETGKN